MGIPQPPRRRRRRGVREPEHDEGEVAGDGPDGVPAEGVAGRGRREQRRVEEQERSGPERRDTNGSPVTKAPKAIAAMAMSPLTNENRPSTTVEECRWVSDGSCIRRVRPNTMAAMSPPTGLRAPTGQDSRRVIGPLGQDRLALTGVSSAGRSLCHD
jgi:hypothetical protein